MKDSGTSDLLEAINACVNGEWHPTRLPEFPYYLDCLLAKDCLNGKRLGYNNEYVQCISLTNYPAGTFPSVLADLQSLPVSFRWSNRRVVAAGIVAPNPCPVVGAVPPTDPIRL